MSLKTNESTQVVKKSLSDLFGDNLTPSAQNDLEFAAKSAANDLAVAVYQSRTSVSEKAENYYSEGYSAGLIESSKNSLQDSLRSGIGNTLRDFYKKSVSANSKRANIGVYSKKGHQIFPVEGYPIVGSAFPDVNVVWSLDNLHCPEITLHSRNSFGHITGIRYATVIVNVNERYAEVAKIPLMLDSDEEGVLPKLAKKRKRVHRA